ncbi:MAG TPA: (d)CMP kinase, partial [Candidatus Kapabacteria bacterium]|nr:(d)CMP kinase [Candidatus Kapabacteria bacterium]
ESGGIVMDGRDIGTVVFPNAELKIYLVASIEARAERRAKELRAKGIPVEIEEIKKQIIERDNYDSSRAISPLRQAEDAILIDTSEMTLEQQSELIIELANKIINS